MLKRSIRFLSVLTIFGVFLALVTSQGASSGVASAQSEEPRAALGHDCNGVTPLTQEANCIFGHIYLNDEVVEGATIRIESGSETLTISSNNGPQRDEAYYSASLTAPPLSASVGDVVKITVSYNDMVSSRTWTVQPGSQQVDMGLIEGYQATSPPSANTALDQSAANAQAEGDTAVPSAEPSDPSFTDIEAPLTGVDHGSVAWGDYDNDGDLDIALTGWDGSNRIAKIYRNDDGTFSDSNISLSNADGAVAWGDYDNDGDLDLLSTGWINTSAKIHRNDGSSFSLVTTLSAGGQQSAGGWGDYDNDGDLDVAVAGPIGRTKIFRNDGDGNFNAVLNFDFGGAGTSVAWGDYDNDGDVDLLLEGASPSNAGATIYQNDGSGNFTDINASLVGGSSVVWGDYDNDGDLDIAVANFRGSKVYQNNNGSFSESASLIGLWDGSVAWGDYDNDDDLDLLITGSYDARIYRNDGSSNFTDINAPIAGVYNASNRAAAWGDYDNDGDVDILFTGRHQNVNPTIRVAKIYRNDSTTASQPPTAAFSASVVAGSAPLNVQFTDQSSGDIVSWTWDFGDGTISGARHPAHEYSLPGTYTVSLTVSGPGGEDSETKVGYITVGEPTSTPNPNVTPRYGLNDGPSTIYIYGHGFSDSSTVKLGGELLEVNFVVLDEEPQRIRAVVPAGVTAGTYDVTVETGSDSVTLPDAYEVLDAGITDDLLSEPEWLWTNPMPMRVGYSDSSVGLLVQHLGGTATLDAVTVEFRLGGPDGEVLGRSLTNLLAPDATESSGPVTWEPTEPSDPNGGPIDYTVCAIIDPDNAVEETKEDNNIICQTITVLPPHQPDAETEPPEVDSFMIDNNAASTNQQAVRLDMGATEYPLDRPSGMNAVRRLQFEYIHGARRWVPVKVSDWVDYETSQSSYDWELVPSYGMRYMQAWTSDNNQNISLKPGVDVIDLLPTEQADTVGQNGVVVYRILLEEGERFAATMTPQSGDPDMYVWLQDGSLRYDANSSGAETVEFDAPFKGTYQIEIHGPSSGSADYRLTFGASRRAQMDDPTAHSRRAPEGDPEKPAVPLDEWPEYYDVGIPPLPPVDPLGGSTIYLPITIR